MQENPPVALCRMCCKGDFHVERMTQETTAVIMTLTKTVLIPTRAGLQPNLKKRRMKDVTPAFFLLPRVY